MKRKVVLICGPLKFAALESIENIKSFIQKLKANIFDSGTVLTEKHLLKRCYFEITNRHSI